MLFRLIWERDLGEDTVAARVNGGGRRGSGGGGSRKFFFFSRLEKESEVKRGFGSKIG